jgi:hypothetical protein
MNKAAGAVLSANQAPHRPGTAPALGPRAAVAFHYTQTDFEQPKLFVVPAWPNPKEPPCLSDPCGREVPTPLQFLEGQRGPTGPQRDVTPIGRHRLAENLGGKSLHDNRFQADEVAEAGCRLLAHGYHVTIRRIQLQGSMEEIPI